MPAQVKRFAEGLSLIAAANVAKHLLEVINSEDDLPKAVAIAEAAGIDMLSKTAAAHNFNLFRAACQSYLLNERSAALVTEFEEAKSYHAAGPVQGIDHFLQACRKLGLPIPRCMNGIESVSQDEQAFRMLQAFDELLAGACQKRGRAVQSGLSASVKTKSGAMIYAQGEEPPPPNVVIADDALAPLDVPDLDDADLLRIFCDEWRDEILPALDDAMREIAGRNGEPALEACKVAQRSFHSAKGSGRMVGLSWFPKIAERAEKALKGHLADGAPDQAMMDARARDRMDLDFRIDCLTKLLEGESPKALIERYDTWAGRIVQNDEPAAGAAENEEFERTQEISPELLAGLGLGSPDATVVAAGIDFEKTTRMPVLAQDVAKKDDVPEVLMPEFILRTDEEAGQEATATVVEAETQPHVEAASTEQQSQPKADDPVVIGDVQVPGWLFETGGVEIAGLSKRLLDLFDKGRPGEGCAEVMEKAGRLAHSIASPAEHMGFPEVSSAARALEAWAFQAARHGFMFDPVEDLNQRAAFEIAKWIQDSCEGISEKIAPAKSIFVDECVSLLTAESHRLASVVPQSLDEEDQDDHPEGAAPLSTPVPQMSTEAVVDDAPPALETVAPGADQNVILPVETVEAEAPVENQGSGAINDALALLIEEEEPAEDRASEPAQESVWGDDDDGPDGAADQAGNAVTDIDAALPLVAEHAPESTAHESPADPPPADAGLVVVEEAVPTEVEQQPEPDIQAYAVEAVESEVVEPAAENLDVIGTDLIEPEPQSEVEPTYQLPAQKAADLVVVARIESKSLRETDYPFAEGGVDDPSYFEDFKIEVDDMQPHMLQAIEARDLSAAKRHLHTLKGAAGMCGMGNLRRMISALETEIEGRDVESAFLLVVDVLSEIPARLEAVDKAIARQAEGSLAPTASDYSVRLSGKVNESLITGVAQSLSGANSRAVLLAKARSALTSQMGQLQSLIAVLNEVVLMGDLMMRSGAVQEAQASGMPGLDRYGLLQEKLRAALERAEDARSSTNEAATLYTAIDADNLDQIVHLEHALEQLSRARYTPFSSLVPRYERVVEDAARIAGKAVRVIVERDGEIDASVLGAVAGPLDHIFRNSVVHGIESPEARALAGKPTVGTIRIRISTGQSGAMVSIRDDGAGLNRERLIERAVSLGLIPESQRQKMTPQQADMLIFRSGISTAKEADDLAGRGVGMDAVRHAIGDVGGTIDVVNSPGVGVEFVLRLPISANQARVMRITVEDHEYAIPVEYIRELVTAEKDLIESGLQSGVVTWQGEEATCASIVSLFGGQRPAFDPEDRFVTCAIMRDTQGRLVVSPTHDMLRGPFKIQVRFVGEISRRYTPGLIGIASGEAGSVIEVCDPVHFAFAQGMSERSQRAATKKTVLVIDDSPSIRKGLRSQIERAGFEVRQAVNGAEAFEDIRKNGPPDFITLDLEMPVMDGITFLETKGKDPILKDVPVMVISTKSLEGHQAETLRLGAVGHMSKPPEWKSLMAVIEKHTGA
jgi:chemosensory pili system protein ChpA (sensor histidine kinase/response regulator)